jgi:hypothetical protein
MTEIKSIHVSVPLFKQSPSITITNSQHGGLNAFQKGLPSKGTQAKMGPVVK